MGKLANKVVVVTGAARGIGKEIAIKCGQEGAKVILSDYDQSQCEQTLKELIDQGIKGYTIPCDVTDERQVESLFEKAEKVYGGIDVLVNNAGLFANNTIEEFSIEQYDRISDVNIKGVLLASKHVIPYLKKRKNSSIVNLASISGHRGTYGHNIYITSKHAVVGITRSSAVELSKHGIRVNAVCPGLIETDMGQQVIDGDGGTPEVRQRYESAYLLGRLGKPTEVANVVSFLASDEASYVTGAMIPVDGGYTAT